MGEVDRDHQTVNWSLFLNNRFFDSLEGQITETIPCFSIDLHSADQSAGWVISNDIWCRFEMPVRSKSRTLALFQMSRLSIHVSLSTKGLRPFQDAPGKDFAFLVGDLVYECPSFNAEFLSPNLLQLRYADPTIDTFRIETEDPHSLVPDVLSLGFGERFDLNPDKVSFLRCVAAELNNAEMLELTLEPVGDDCSHQNLIARLEFLSQTDADCEREIRTMASHFHEFSVTDCANLSFSVLQRVLSHPAIVIETEDALCAIIVDHLSRDLSSVSLLEFLHFE
jgi:hypothetical protein